MKNKQYQAGLKYTKIFLKAFYHQGIFSTNKNSFINIFLKSQVYFQIAKLESQVYFRTTKLESFKE